MSNQNVFFSVFLSNLLGLLIMHTGHKQNTLCLVATAAAAAADVFVVVYCCVVA